MLYEQESKKNICYKKISICMYFKLAKSPSNNKIFSPNNFYQLDKEQKLSIQKKNDEKLKNAFNLEK